MAGSTTTTVDDYLAELPEDRRAVVTAVREVVLRHLPAGYREGMNWGMICYEIPLEQFPDTYNGQPLLYAALAAQKNYYTLHLLASSQHAESMAALKEAYQKAGKKLDMGKSCLRFRRLEDLPLDVIGQLIARITPEKYIAFFKATRST
jgi:hypothetical protein